MKHEVHEWIRLDTSDLNRSRMKEVRGVMVLVRLSATDVPVGVRGAFDHNEGRFRIDFKYEIDHEPRKRIKETELTLEVGKHSGRLLSLLIDTESQDANAVRLAIEAVELPETGASRLNALLNRELIEGVLHTRAKEISEMMPA